jgi:hypothetical protein
MALTDNYDRQQIQSHLRMRQTVTDRGGVDRGSRVAFDSGPAISARQIDRARAILDWLGIRHRL